MFCKNCGKNINERKSCPYCEYGKTDEYASLKISKKWNLPPQASSDLTSRFIAGILQIFTGCFGIGRFYMKSYKIGIIQILVTLLCAFLAAHISIIFLSFGFIWGVADGVMILSGKFNSDISENTTP